jgi:hypothetical protein
MIAKQKTWVSSVEGNAAPDLIDKPIKSRALTGLYQSLFRDLSPRFLL